MNGLEYLLFSIGLWFAVGVVMRWGLITISGFLLAGCASKPPVQVVTAPSPRVYDDAVAAALVFDPPAISDGQRLNVTREGRSQAAFGGFDELITTFYYLRVDDYQQGFNGNCRNSDRFQREAITERVGVSYR